MLCGNLSRAARDFVTCIPGQVQLCHALTATPFSLLCWEVRGFLLEFSTCSRCGVGKFFVLKTVQARH